MLPAENEGLAVNALLRLVVLVFAACLGRHSVVCHVATSRRWCVNLMPGWAPIDWLITRRIAFTYVGPFPACCVAPPPSLRAPFGERNTVQGCARCHPKADGQVLQDDRRKGCRQRERYPQSLAGGGFPLFVSFSRQFFRVSAVVVK